MSGLNWLCLTMALLKSLFYDSGLFSWSKPMIYDRQRRLLCIVSSLVALLLEELDFLCCLGGVCSFLTNKTTCPMKLSKRTTYDFFVKKDNLPVAASVARRHVACRHRQWRQIGRREATCRWQQATCHLATLAATGRWSFLTIMLTCGLF
jgi:hypothetical protein